MNHLLPSHSRAQQPQIYFRKLTSCMTFVTHKLSSEQFLTTHANSDNCCQRYRPIATFAEIFILVHIYLLGPKVLWWNFIKIGTSVVRLKGQLIPFETRSADADEPARRV